MIEHKDNVVPPMPWDVLERQLDDSQEKVEMTPDEKRALSRWVSSGHSVYEQPDSKYLCPYCMPYEYDFLAVYRLDKDLDEATKGMSSEEERTYLREFFGYSKPSKKELRRKEALENTPELIRRELRLEKRFSSHLMEFVISKGLWGEAEKYLDDHKDEEADFEAD